MKQRKLFVLLALVMVFSLALTACQPAAAPAEPAPAEPAPAEPTKAPEAPAEPTKAPEAPAAPAFEAMKVAAPDCNYGGNMLSIESVDELTVKFTLCNPDPAFLAKIAVPAFPVLDKDYLDAAGGDAAKINENPVGTGPYMVKEWVRGDSITFVPNPNYWGEAPKNQQFILKWNKEAAARLLDLQSGNVDGIVNVATDDLAAVKEDANLALYPRKFNNFLYLGMNNLKPPFDDERVRQAFAMAIDKEAIVADFYPEGASASTQFLPPGVKPGFTDGYSAPAYDLEKAKALLEEAAKDGKFDFNTPITLSYAERTRPYFPQPTKIAQAVQQQLTELGVKVDLNLMEWGAYLPANRAGEHQIFFLGWSEDFPDATNWYDVFLTGSSKSFGDPYPDILELVKKGAALGDAAERQKIYDELNPLIDKHVPAVTIANGATFFAFKTGIDGVVIGPYNESYQNMTTESGTLVFSQDGEPVSLDCADETDGSSFTACLQLFNTLYDFKWGSAELQPALAQECKANENATEWTCTLKSGVKFSNGAALDSGDVVASFTRMFDRASVNSKGNTGVYQYWLDFFGPKALNQKE